MNMNSPSVSSVRAAVSKPTAARTLRLRPWVLASFTGLALLGAGTGCSTNQNGVNTVEPANPVYVERSIPDKRVIRDHETARSVAVLKVIDGSSDTGLARIGVEVQNLSRSVYRFNYRFDWFDHQGLPVATPTATMLSQTIEAGQVFTLTSVAPTPNAKDFRLSIQKSTRGFSPLLRKN